MAILQRRQIRGLIVTIVTIAVTTSPLLANRTRASRTRTTPAPRMLAVATGETLAVFSTPAAPIESDTPALVRDSVQRTVVVLLPGTIGSAFSMRHITKALVEAGNTTVVVDLLGHGMSSRPAIANYSLTQQSVRLAAVLDSLHIKRALVVAHSTSATVALHLAASDSNRVVSLLSLAGGPVSTSGTGGVRTAITFASLLDNPIGRALGRRKFRGAMRDQSASDKWLTDDVMREYLAPYERNLRGSLRTLKAMSEAVEPTPIASRLADVRAPLQLLIGDKKSASAPSDEQVQLLKRSLVQFRVDTVSRSGTMLHEERPDAVVAAILALLRAPGA